MQVRDSRPDDSADIHAFLTAHGWAHRLGTPGEFAVLLQRSQRTAVAVHEGQIVGFARGITDGISNGYLSMVAVCPERRRQGLGTRLVQHIVAADPNVTWVLRAGREGSASFFATLGFQPSAVAMERKRGQSGA